MLKVQPSPTTGKFGFLQSGGFQNSTMTVFPDKSKENFYENLNSASFAFKPIADSGPPFQVNASNRVLSPSPSLKENSRRKSYCFYYNLTHAKSETWNQNPVRSMK